MSNYTTIVDPLSGRSWRVPNNRLNPWHTITITTETWHMAHPITCDLDRCPFDAVAQTWQQAPRGNGVYRWWGVWQEPERWIGGDDE